MSETTPSAQFKTAACPATWDLIEQLVQLESSKNRLHLEYMGKAMPVDVYLRFQKLRDERIPALRSQLCTGLASAPDLPPADFAHAYADQLMLHCLVPDESTPKAQPADALNAETVKKAARYDWIREQGMLADGSRHPHSWRCVALLADMGGERADEAIDAAMAAAQQGGAA
ncbi:hypothetical protein HS961_13425 [Comamonas piscis]|uniref:Uncharacterized protein n=1 Tax=Comamonas piscis TaxID=1562974 RepID=A0A7G5EIC2_9BURK|nr:hypothetical protein [Comamonas piscis]QMV73747.1 hypothetical protein HS961_13425 [Comamonas piscis]WSO32171.1 hypothetical protein VUJ63_13465 [Comamonas piscis]